MKNTKLIIFINILIFLIAAAGITYFYISNHLLSDVSEIKAKSMIAIFLQIGCVGAVIPVILFTLMNWFFKKKENKARSLFILLTLGLLVIIAVYIFIMYLTFHEFSSPIQ